MLADDLLVPAESVFAERLVQYLKGGGFPRNAARCRWANCFHEEVWFTHNTEAVGELVVGSISCMTPDGRKNAGGDG